VLHPTPQHHTSYATKLFEYMAAGLPVIASPVGANAEIVTHGETGLLAASPEEWVEAVATLVRDCRRRLHMGAAGRQRIEQHYSISRAVDAWTRLLGQ
jgi:glycosyltransferase involved in cell wall biosynthesis